MNGSRGARVAIMADQTGWHTRQLQQALRQTGLRAHLNSRPTLYVVDARVGASDHGISLRVVTESAWHALFARNMFIVPEGKYAGRAPEALILHAPSFEADPATGGPCFVLPREIELLDRRRIGCTLATGSSPSRTEPVGREGPILGG